MLRTFYQRMDLSAEYTVDQDGTISLPRLSDSAASDVAETSACIASWPPIDVDPKHPTGIERDHPVSNQP